MIKNGTAENQLRLIASNTANTLTWASAGTAPDNTSHYHIEGFDAGTVSSAANSNDTASSTSASIAGNVLTVGNYYAYFSISNRKTKSSKVPVTKTFTVKKGQTTTIIGDFSTGKTTVTTR
jgi:ABC-type glutathione transport system ATPase component